MFHYRMHDYDASNKVTIQRSTSLNLDLLDEHRSTKKEEMVLTNNELNAETPKGFNRRCTSTDSAACEEIRDAIVTLYWKNLKGMWVYHINVLTGTSAIFPIERSFSDFIKLYDQLTKKYPHLEFPKPASVNFLDRMMFRCDSYEKARAKMLSNESVLKNVEAMQMFLEVIKDYELMGSVAFEEFIGPNPFNPVTGGYVSLSEFHTPISTHLQYNRMFRAISEPRMPLRSEVQEL